MTVKLPTLAFARVPLTLALTILFLGCGLGWCHRNMPDFVRNGLGGVLIPAAAIASAVKITNLLLHVLTRKNE